MKKEKPRSYDKEAIKQIPITDYARTLGFDVVVMGNKYSRLREHDSCIINTQNNTFVRYSRANEDNARGSIIDFCMHFTGKNLNEAIIELGEMYNCYDLTEIDPKKKRDFEKILDNNTLKFLGLSYSDLIVNRSYPDKYYELDALHTKLSRNIDTIKDYARFSQIKIADGNDVELNKIMLEKFYKNINSLQEKLCEIEKKLIEFEDSEKECLPEKFDLNNLHKMFKEDRQAYYYLVVTKAKEIAETRHQMFDEVKKYLEDKSLGEQERKYYATIGNRFRSDFLRAMEIHNNFIPKLK